MDGFHDIKYNYRVTYEYIYDQYVEDVFNRRDFIDATNLD